MILIRTEEATDVPAIRRLNELAFGRPDEARLVDRLRANAKIVLSLVAVMDGDVVGHILFSAVSIEGDPGLRAGVGLAPMSVLPAHQRIGIGSKLVEEGLARCRDAGLEFAVVLGHSNYYPRFGFAPARTFGLTSEYLAADESFMAVKLRAGGLIECSGLVRYQPEFNEL
jgi:putative acetyltransferase